MNAIDLPRLRGDLRAVSDSITSLKRVLRAPWTEPMAERQRRLVRLKLRATELCVLRAHLRGRFHLARPPAWLDLSSFTAGDGDRTWDRAAWHAEVAARVARDYAIVEASAPDAPVAPVTALPTSHPEEIQS